jgi:hypothetical protein
MLAFILFASICFSMGFILGVVFKTTRLKDKEIEPVYRVPSLPKSSTGFVLIWKDKNGLYYCNSNSEELLKGYCPDVYNYFSTTDSAVNDFNEILKSQK